MAPFRSTSATNKTVCAACVVVLIQLEALVTLVHCISAGCMDSDPTWSSMGHS